MTIEYRVVVHTQWGTVHRWPKKSLDAAQDTRAVYLEAETTYYRGCEVQIETRTISKWEEVTEDERQAVVDR